MRSGSTTAFLAMLLFLFAAAAPPAVAAPQVGGSYDIPDGVGSNNEIVQGPDGNMWVTLENANGVAQIKPDGTVTQFPLANTAYGITVGPDDNLWVSTVIGVAKVPPGDPASAEAFTLTGFANGRGITVGPDDRLWVAGDDKLVRFSPADPEGSAETTTIAGMSARGMDTGSDGLLWIADSSGRVLSATATDTPDVTEYTVGGGPQDVGAGPDGQVAYANPLSSPHQTVGRITPGGSVLPTELSNSDPFGVVFGQDDAYWIARSQANDLLRLTPGGATTSLTGFPDSGGVGPRKVATGPGNTLWVTLDTPEKVAVVSGVEPPKLTPNPPVAGAAVVKFGKKPGKRVRTKRKRAKVVFRFSSPSAGSTFECALAKGKRKSRFKTCNSPKRYRLRPGRYRFRVRAVVDGKAGKAKAAKFKVLRKR